MIPSHCPGIPWCTAIRCRQIPARAGPPARDLPALCAAPPAADRRFRSSWWGVGNIVVTLIVSLRYHAQTHDVEHLPYPFRHRSRDLESQLGLDQIAIHAVVARIVDL